MEDGTKSGSRLIRLLLLGVMLLGVGCSSMALREQRQEALFEEFDVDQNGRLSEQEFVDEVIEDLFEGYDHDRNGKISREEFLERAVDRDLAEREYPLMDSEQKGYILPRDVYRNQALVARLREDFATLDPAAKGYVTRADLPKLQEGQEAKKR